MNKPLLNLEIIESVCRQLPNSTASQKFWVESLTLSLDSLDASLERFNMALVEKNVAELSKSAHKISGTIGFVGALKLCDRLNSIQAECDSAKFSWPLPDEIQIRATLTQIILELQAARLNPPN